ncbi:uncharacterized protein LOC5516850 [Nematostella vectensis]|uniref:uncharacterized protein LOC5516850 n=1 Tax=Nematostella vectensis TaxID=45351 RepID=UPI0020771481|nr:uncharacterized protein LOC5516850 [Nematostella vectensis]
MVGSFFSLCFVASLAKMCVSQILHASSDGFEKEKKAYLNVTAKEVHKVKRLGQCALKSIKDASSQSFNFAVRPDEYGMHTCEVLYTNRCSNDSVKYHENKDFDHYNKKANGCNLLNPCLNGGTYTGNFVCACPRATTGDRCQRSARPESCVDMYDVSSNPLRGVYMLFRSDTETEVKVYCDFEPPKKAWTLIESYASKHNMEFRGQSYLDDYSVNEEAPGDHSRYRLSRERMQAVKATAVSYRVTCKFLTRKNVTDRDYLEGRLSAWDIIEEESIAACKNVTYVDIEGYSCWDCTLALQQKKGKWHLCATPLTGCDLRPPEYVSNLWEAFGWYNPMQETFLCTDSLDSTTEYWLGHEMP